MQITWRNRLALLILALGLVSYLASGIAWIQYYALPEVAGREPALSAFSNWLAGSIDFIVFAAVLEYLSRVAGALGASGRKL